MFTKDRCLAALASSIDEAALLSDVSVTAFPAVHRWFHFLENRRHISSAPAGDGTTSTKARDQRNDGDYKRRHRELRVKWCTKRPLELRRDDVVQRPRPRIVDVGERLPVADGAGKDHRAQSEHYQR